jgi:hypothetical protein
LRFDFTDTASVAVGAETASDTTLLVNNAGIYAVGVRFFLSLEHSLVEVS